MAVVERERTGAPWRFCGSRARSISVLRRTRESERRLGCCERAGEVGAERDP
jgi:hypothetical protein